MNATETKISYIIPSIKPIECVKEVIKIIRSLPSHNHEIIVISPNHTSINIDGVKSLSDDNIDGAVYSFNKGYKNSSGQLIFPFADDQELSSNFLEIYEFFDTPEAKRKKLKIFNIAERMGGPGKNSYHKLDEIKNIHKPWQLDDVFNFNVTNSRPYTTYFFPILLRESIEKYMNDVIYNENFVHSWCDHWSGYFSDIINDEIAKDETEYMGPKNIWCKEIKNFNIIKSPNHIKYLNNDKETFIRLVKNCTINENYNYKL